MPWGDITKQSLKMVTQRLSLRPPQARSLEILVEVLERTELVKGADPAAALAAVREAWPQVEDFEREFPSLCFALATGGDNYETGRGVRLEGGRAADLFGSGVHVDIFNIDKINKDSKIKRLQETIGEKLLRLSL